jgi:hypothetical protein
MFNLLFSLILSIVTINSLNSMEFVTRKTSKSRSADANIGSDVKNPKGLTKTEKKRNGFRKSVSSTDVLPNSKKTDAFSKRDMFSKREALSTREQAAPIESFDKPEHPLIQAVRDKNETHIKLLLSIPNFNPNVTDRWGNTPVHITALSGNKDLLIFFSQDHRFDFSLRNKRGCIAHELIDSEDIEKDMTLRKAFFPRYIPSMLVDQKAVKIFDLAMDKKDQGVLTQEDRDLLDQYTKDSDMYFNQCVAQIIASIKKNNDTQDTELPTETQLTATPEFIKKMLIFRLGILLNNQ